jgi:hypothetical protein
VRRRSVSHLPRFTGRIKGTINDEFDIVAENEDEARDLALMEWRYVEFEDLAVDSIQEVEDAG